MTRDNLIFLGTCALLGPSLGVVSNSSESVKEVSVKNAEAWATMLYDKQHGTSATQKASPIGEVEFFGRGAWWPSKWKVQVCIVNGWSDSNNKGLFDKIFTSKEEAEKASKIYGCEHLLYRTVQV